MAGMVSLVSARRATKTRITVAWGKAWQWIQWQMAPVCLHCCTGCPCSLSRRIVIFCAHQSHQPDIKPLLWQRRVLLVQVLLPPLTPGIYKASIFFVPIRDYSLLWSPDASLVLTIAMAVVKSNRFKTIASESDVFYIYIASRHSQWLSSTLIILLLLSFGSKVF